MTEMRRQEGCFDMLHPDNRTIVYIFMWEEKDGDDVKIRFEYDASEGPTEEVWGKMPEDVLDVLTGWPSKEMWFSSDKVAMEKHDARIAIARQKAKDHYAEDARHVIGLSRQQLNQLAVERKQIEGRIEILEQDIAALNLKVRTK